MSEPATPAGAGSATPAGAGSATPAGLTGATPAGPTGAGSAEPTGVAPVDAALRRLGDADGLEPAEQVSVYEDVHRALQDALADLAEEAGG